MEIFTHGAQAPLAGTSGRALENPALDMSRREHAPETGCEDNWQEEQPTGQYASGGAWDRQPWARKSTAHDSLRATAMDTSGVCAGTGMYPYRLPSECRRLFDFRLRPPSTDKRITSPCTWTTGEKPYLLVVRLSLASMMRLSGKPHCQRIVFARTARFARTIKAP